MTGEVSPTCSVEGCNGRRFSRGWCSKHYSRWKRHGDLDRGYVHNHCAVKGCERRAHGEGYCSLHYARWKRLGDPTAGGMVIPEGPVALPLHDVDGAVIAETIVDGIDSLWLDKWAWSLSPSGYAYRTDGNRTVLLARLLLGLTSAPTEFQSDHINRNRLDNRRSNLRVVSAEQNAANRGGIYSADGAA